MAAHISADTHTDYSVEVNEHCSAVTATDINQCSCFFSLLFSEDGVVKFMCRSVNQLTKTEHGQTHA